MGARIGFPDLTQANREWLMDTAETIASLIRDCSDVFAMDPVIDAELEGVEEELEELLTDIMYLFPENSFEAEMVFRGVKITIDPTREPVSLAKLRGRWITFVRSMSRPWRDAYDLYDT